MTTSVLSTCSSLLFRWLGGMAILALVCAAGQLSALDVVNITASSGAANEQGPVPGRFTVTRSGSTGTVTVLYSVRGSAVSSDYTTPDFTPPTTTATPGTGSVTFIQGETSHFITITPIDDDVIEGKESVIISLTSNAAYIIGPDSAAQLDIADNDSVAHVVVVDSQADEDSALSGFVNDLEIQRRGIFQVLWQDRNPGTTTGALPFARTLAVGFSGTAALTTDYVVSHKIMGTAVAGGPSHIGSESSSPTTGLGYNVYAYLVGDSVIAISAGSAPIPTGATITFTDDPTTYTVGPNSSGLSPSTIPIAPPLGRNLANATTITVTSGVTPPTGFVVNRPYPAGSTSVKLGDGSGGIFRGDAIQFGADTSFYVATTDLGGGTLGAGSVNFTRYSGGGTGSGLNLAITSTVEAKTMFTTTINGGVAQFLVPASSDRVEFSITPVADAEPEGEETVMLTLINDKDYATTDPTVGRVHIADANVITGIALGSNAGKPNTSGYFVVTFKNGPFPVKIDVPYTIDASSTAIAGTDYTALSGLLSIPAGQTTGVIQVNPLNTAATGLTQVTVSLSLSKDYKLAGSGGDTDNSSATLNITDSIGEVSVAASASPAIEHPSAPVPSFFTVSLNRASSGAVNVNYTVSGSAVAGTRYQTLTGSVTIPDGSTTATVQVMPIDNQVADGTQDVVLTLAPGQGYTITATGATNALTRIIDDEPVVYVVRVRDAAKIATTGIFQIGYPGVTYPGIPGPTALNREVEVFFTYSGTAVSGTDYTTSSAASVKIPANALSTSVIISPKATPDDATDKDVTLTITANAAYTISTPSDQLTIFGAANPTSSKPTPGTITTGSSSGGGCGLGSGLATLAGLGMLVLLAFRRRAL